VRFVGQQEDMAAVFSALNVVAIPSDSEGHPFVALEAAAAGKPVVAAAVGGLREIVRHDETGLLFPLGDEDLLGDALIAVLRDPDGAAWRADAARREVDRFGIEDHVRRLRDHYLQVAQSGQRSPAWTWRRAPAASRP
jgi:glycosyltransferase involved in cell wall biosynthesis